MLQHKQGNLSQACTSYTYQSSCYCLHWNNFLQDIEAKEGGAKPSKAAKPATKKSAGAADEAKAAKAAEKQRQAQLEMLMMDDNALQDLARIGNTLCFVVVMGINLRMSVPMSLVGSICVCIQVLKSQAIIPYILPYIFC